MRFVGKRRAPSRPVTSVRRRTNGTYCSVLRPCVWRLAFHRCFGGASCYFSPSFSRVQAVNAALVDHSRSPQRAHQRHVADTVRCRGPKSQQRVPSRKMDQLSASIPAEDASIEDLLKARRSMEVGNCATHARCFPGSRTSARLSPRPRPRREGLPRRIVRRARRRAAPHPGEPRSPVPARRANHHQLEALVS